MEQSSLRGRGILIVITAALLVWAFFHKGIKLGQDLKGGTTLRFSLDIDGAKRAGRIAADADPVEVVSKTLTVIRDRIDKYGLAEINLTQYGENKFLISLPAGAASQAEGIIDVVAQLGDLKFRIEVLPDDQYRRDPAPTRTGVWPNPDPASFKEYKEKEVAVWRKARARGEKYVPTTDERFSIVKEQGKDGSDLSHFHVMEETGFPEDIKFDGGIVENPKVGVGERNDPVVLYQVRNEFQNVFGQWTGKNVGLPMAIILNDEYKSAPVINSMLTTNVQITLGSGRPRPELEREAKSLTTVLQTGSLKIRPDLEAHTVMGATLAGASRERGILSIIVAFVLVLVFMVVYYRGSGIIANVALLLNLVMLVGFLAFFQAVLTLPGIAGIVLTVGMAVDANILINERIREERRGGRTLRRAVAEGYDRALSAIIDANVTSIITAIFLYNFGSGPVQGFAITLAIGLMVSMFTAVFVTRTIFESLMKGGVIKDVSAWGSGEPPKVSWIGLRRFFMPLSVIGIVVGLLIFSITDRYTLYDIDFTGGYKMQAEFHEPTSPDEVKALLAKESSTQVVKVKGFDEQRNPITRTVEVPVGPYPGAQVLSVGTEGREVEINVQRLFAEHKVGEQEQAQAFQQYVRKILEDRLMPDWLVPQQVPGQDAPRAINAFTYVAPEDGAADEELEPISGGFQMRMAFRDPGEVLTADMLREALTDSFPYWVMEDGREVPASPAEKGLVRKVVVRGADSGLKAVRYFDVWMKSTTAGDKQVEREPTALRQRLAEYLGGDGFQAFLLKKVGAGTPEAKGLEDFGLSQPFPSEDHIGSSVATKLKNDAILALFLSLIGIIIYIAIRFKSRSMGFAAVLCLFHDVAITLGIVAIANSLGVVDAKINLAMVAAFLTLVGYSVNDTVVIFDRIRENRGKRPTLTAELIDASINQTLARTIRTSVTFLLVCLALFGFNFHQRNVLEGFAFLLILGSVIGTYSTVAISAPLLLYLPWLWSRLKEYAPKEGLVTQCLTNPALIALTPVAGVLWLAWAIAFGVGAFVAGLVMVIPWSLSGEGRIYDRKVA
jgi:SecD/SecF fusion protein